MKKMITNRYNLIFTRSVNIKLTRNWNNERESSNNNEYIVDTLKKSKTTGKDYEISLALILKKSLCF